MCEYNYFSVSQKYEIELSINRIIKKSKGSKIQKFKNSENVTKIMWKIELFKNPKAQICWNINKRYIWE